MSEAGRTTAHAESLLRQVEHDYGLLSIKMDGWAVWPLFRLMSGYALERLPLTGVSSLSRAQRVRLVARDLVRLRRLRKRDVLVKSLVSGLLDAGPRGFRDAWFGEFLDTTPDRLLVTGTNSPRHVGRLARAQHDSDLTTVLIDSASALMGRVRAPAEVGRTADALRNALVAGFGSDALSLRTLQDGLLRFHWTKHIFGRLLDRVRPRVILTADPGEFALIAAAREQGIATYELQHGSIDRNHHGYGWTADALPFRDAMPVADHLLLYGAYWRDELAVNGFWGNAAKVVGSLRMDAFRERTRRAPSAGDVTIVVTSQGIEVGRLADQLRSALTYAPRSDMKVIVKLHPAYESTKEPYVSAFAGDRRVEVLLGNEGPSTFELLTTASLHVSISSTVHFEALGLGVPTVILPLATHEIALPLHEAGHAALAADGRELGAYFAAPGPKVPPEVSGYYFRPDALPALRSLVAGARVGGPFPTSEMTS